jgi:CHASE1-domain containing sensor protein
MRGRCSAATALFNASDEVTRKDWADFVRSLRLEKDFPAMQALASARDVDDAGLDALVREMRAGGVADFSPRPPGRRDRYVINVYTAPDDEGNRRALGLRHVAGRGPARRDATGAGQTGEPSITRRLTLKTIEQGRSDAAPAFIIYLPVPLRGRRPMAGFVLSPFRMPVLMDDLVRSSASRHCLDCPTVANPSPDAAAVLPVAMAGCGSMARLARSETLQFRRPAAGASISPACPSSNSAWMTVVILTLDPCSAVLFSLLAGVGRLGAGHHAATARSALARDMTRSLRESKPGCAR